MAKFTKRRRRLGIARALKQSGDIFVIESSDLDALTF